MKIEICPEWKEYKLIDSGNGKRLEQFGKYTLIRPDPQAIWKSKIENEVWNKADAVFENSGSKEGWTRNVDIPERWEVAYEGLTFWAKLTPFKHTGIFPEQAVQWNWIKDKIEKSGGDINVLNLFGYTGISSLVCAKAGAKVTHIDSSKPAITWARDNQLLSGLGEKPIRWIPEDAIKFVEREEKRGNKYDAIIMDPPVYGHGPTGEVWDFNKHFPILLEQCKKILSDKPLFIVINAYAISSSALMLENMLKDLDLKGTIEAGELAIKEENSDRLLSTGIFGRWSE
jgi:23S rRNA (cytosine1962-C5)-methyltransferase